MVKILISLDYVCRRILWLTIVRTLHDRGSCAGLCGHKHVRKRSIHERVRDRVCIALICRIRGAPTFGGSINARPYVTRSGILLQLRKLRRNALGIPRVHRTDLLAVDAFGYVCGMPRARRWQGETIMISEARRLLAGASARGTIFVAGLVVGLGLGAVVTAANSAEDDLSNFSRSLLYAIAELSVDTEFECRKYRRAFRTD